MGAGASALTITNPTDTFGRAILLGGTPFGDEIVMWWNFIGRGHHEIAGFHGVWQTASARFGRVDG